MMKYKQIKIILRRIFAVFLAQVVRITLHK